MIILVFIYSIMCYGISSALVYYNGPFGIISKFRDFIASSASLNELFSCMFCLPTNIGFMMSILSMFVSPSLPFTPFTVLFFGHYYLWPLIVIFDGFFTGAVVSITDTVVYGISSDRATFDDDSTKQLITYDNSNKRQPH